MDVLVRVFVGEDEEIGGRPLYRLVVEELRRRGVRGATVLRSILGYGTTGEFHYEGIEALSYNLPVVIEFVEEEGKAMEVLEELSELLRKGLVTVESAQVWE